MKKSLIYIKSFIALAILLVSCDETLDRNLTPADQISAIVVEFQDGESVNPNDNSGLAPAYSTLVGNLVTFSSSTPNENVAERVWSIPELLTASSLDFEEIIEMGSVSRSFSRANNTDNAGERFGIPIILTETLINGDVNRYETQIQVRLQIIAGIIAPSVATINVPTSIQSINAEAMNLASTDINGEGQVVLEWDFGAGFVQTPTGPANKVVSTNVNESFNVIFDTPTDINGEQITLTVTRNYPSKSTSTAQASVIVVSGLTPNRGLGKDAIKLSADGNQIVFGYEEPIGDISVISAANFELSIVADEIVDASAKSAFENISVTDVAIDPGNPNNLVLTLSSTVPSILMDNLSLSFLSTSLTSQSGEEISLFLNSTVFPTGSNEFNGLYGGFENEIDAWDNAWENHFAELLFSDVKPFVGDKSLLFNVTSSPTGIGAWRQETDPTVFSPSKTGQFEVSFWVFVESTDATAVLNMFWLDGSVGQWLDNVGALVNDLETNKWVKVSGQRNFAQGAATGPFIRVVNGNAVLYVDHIDIRPVDDGK